MNGEGFVIAQRLITRFFALPIVAVPHVCNDYSTLVYAHEFVEFQVR